jgi:hypothetical protein
MSYHHPPHRRLRLELIFAAEALIYDFDREAYAEARRRAEEASSDSLERDWSEVALLVARETGRRSSFLARMFQ